MPKEIDNPMNHTNNWEGKLRACLEYCREQNGMDECKNCGLDEAMINGVIKEKLQALHDEVGEMKVRQYDALCLHLSCNIGGIAQRRDCKVERKKAEDKNLGLQQIQEIIKKKL